MANTERLSALFDRYYKGTATLQERDEFLRILQEASDAELEALLQAEWLNESDEPFAVESFLKERLLSKIVTVPEDDLSLDGTSAKRIWSVRLVAAAVVVSLIAISVFLVWNKNGSVPVASQPSVPFTQPDVSPGKNVAILTLANGSTVMLDQKADGTVAEQGGVQVSNKNGQLTYQPGEATSEVLYNTVVTPRGGQYQMVLSDGTKVWLNADSYLRFPASFAGRERRVELKGEGYFEVVRNTMQPFYVSVSGSEGRAMDVKVLGTHFNVNSYSDEALWRTTLLEGSVSVNTASSQALLKEGQQARFLSVGSVPANGKGKGLDVASDIDVEQVVAWKNGIFDFDREHITQIMRQLARWYDMQVIFKGPIPERHYTGAIRRSVNLSEVIRMLTLSGGVQFAIKGKEIIVQEK